MGRGLDGFRYLFVGRLCSFEGPPLRRAPPAPPRAAGARSRQISVAIAWGKHLFPFRTEQLSPTAPMVLVPYGTGRVGRRRFLSHDEPPPFGVARGRLGAPRRARAAPRAAR